MHLVFALMAWGLLVLLGWSTWRFTQDLTTVMKRLHQIPCANCQFFTGNYYLKCAVRPSVALTEEAISCTDFYP